MGLKKPAIYGRDVFSSVNRDKFGLEKQAMVPRVHARWVLVLGVMRNGQAAEVEVVFWEDLRRNRRSGRSLFGLMESLKAQKKTMDAEWVRS